jgi:hypothetical protein
MRRATTTLAAALAIGFLPFARLPAAADDNASVTLPAELNVGRRLAIDIQKNVEFGGGGLTWTVHVDAEVMAASPAGADVRWTCRRPADEDVAVMGFERALGAGVGEFSALVGDTTLSFQAGRTAAAMRLLNGGELRAAMAGAQPQYRIVVENWLDYWSSQPGPPKFKQKEIAALTSAGVGLAAALPDVSDDQITGMLLKEARLIFLLQGQSLPATGGAGYADDLPGPVRRAAVARDRQLPRGQPRP